MFEGVRKSQLLAKPHRGFAKCQLFESFYSGANEKRPDTELLG